MALFKSSNPALNEKAFNGYEEIQDDTQVMTVRGTVNKTAILLLLALGSAIYTWRMFATTGDFSLVSPYIGVGAIGGFITAIIIIFKKEWSPYLAPAYALLEGLALGAISSAMNTAYHGIVLEAVVLTFGICFSLLIIYRLGIIKATENFKLIVASATAGIAFYYLITIVLSFFGITMPLIYDSSPMGILFSLAVVVIAALNLVMDFDFIEQGVANRVPKFMEWYGAFGLMVTLVWLYLELLRLLSKLRKR